MDVLASADVTADQVLERTTPIAEGVRHHFPDAFREMGPRYVQSVRVEARMGPQS
jgi:hypothetical protein